MIQRMKSLSLNLLFYNKGTNNLGINLLSLIFKAPSIICSKRQFQNLLLFKNNKLGMLIHTRIVYCWHFINIIKLFQPLNRKKIVKAYLAITVNFCLIYDKHVCLKYLTLLQKIFLTLNAKVSFNSI